MGKQPGREMMEAMEEVDAMGLGGAPLIEAPRPALPPRRPPVRPTGDTASRPLLFPWLLRYWACFMAVALLVFFLSSVMREARDAPPTELRDTHRRLAAYANNLQNETIRLHEDVARLESELRQVAAVVMEMKREKARKKARGPR